MNVVYGMEIKEMDDEFVQLATMAMGYLSESRRSGAVWVEFVPFLRHIPAWVPGAYAAKLGARTRPVVQRMRNMPYDLVQHGEVTVPMQARLLLMNNDRFKMSVSPHISLRKLRVRMMSIAGLRRKNVQETWLVLHTVVRSFQHVSQPVSSLTSSGC